MLALNGIDFMLQEEIDEAGDEGVPEQPPTLALFKKQVDLYESIYIQVEKFDVSINLLLAVCQPVHCSALYVTGHQGDRVMVPC